MSTKTMQVLHCGLFAAALAVGAVTSTVALAAEDQPTGQETETVVCEGDCDGGEVVTINELVTLVNIVLEVAQPSACANGIPAERAVDISLIVGAVNNVLKGCRPVIRLSDGILRGEIDRESRRFLGIPYAAQPDGDLRWRPPQPPLPWTGVLSANEFYAGGSRLALNVWTPDPAPTQPQPVMVWFHGGGHQPVLFANSHFTRRPELQFDGRTLAETRNVIVVTVDFRLGVMGFFSHPALAADDTEYPYAGNYGLLDERAALQWVRDNISAFGGDPGNVTIFGESAGAGDVCYHMVSPGSRGLFHRAISQSGGCTIHQATAADAAPTAEELVSMVGCSDNADVAACLRNVPDADLFAADRTLGRPFDVIIDGGFLPDQPRTLFDMNEFSHVPYVVGSNADEGNEGTVEVTDGFLGTLRILYGDRAEEIAALYPVDEFESVESALQHIVGDAETVCPSYDTGRRAGTGGADVYLYNFARPDADPLYRSLGADHQAEIGYVFGSIDLMTDEDREVGRAMQGYWSRLARNGDPNGEGAVNWPRWEDAVDRRISFDVPISVLTDFRRARCQFWWGVYDEEFE